MGKSTNYADALLKHIFTNLAMAGYGDTNGPQPSATAGNLYVSLHTGDPGASDDQTVNEANYTGYARIPVARSGAGWTVTGNQVVNAADVTFGLCTAGSNTITHVGVGTLLTGAGHLPYSFPLISNYYDATAKASSDVITAPGHTLIVNDPIEFVPAPGGTLPGGISVGTVYYVKTVSGNDITISATVGGATLDITTDGSFVVGKIGTLAVSVNITPQFLAGALVIVES